MIDGIADGGGGGADGTEGGGGGADGGGGEVGNIDGGAAGSVRPNAFLAACSARDEDEVPLTFGSCDGGGGGGVVLAEGTLGGVNGAIEEGGGGGGGGVVLVELVLGGDSGLNVELCGGAGGGGADGVTAGAGGGAGADGTGGAAMEGFRDAGGGIAGFLPTGRGGFALVVAEFEENAADKGVGLRPLR